MRSKVKNNSIVRAINEQHDIILAYRAATGLTTLALAVALGWMWWL